MFPEPTMAAVTFDIFYVSFLANTAVTLPTPANTAVTTSPGTTGMADVHDPGSTTWPASSTTPRSPNVLANQARAIIGWPRAAPPAPVATTSPFLNRLHPASRMSTSAGSVAWLPSTTPPDEALSATVSSSVI